MKSLENMQKEQEEEDKEFRVNNYITLKLEASKRVSKQTVIYINHDKFLLCKKLLLNIPIDKIEYFNDIKSIDEASDKLSDLPESEEHASINISPEEEFLAHCSNLKAWEEHRYDTHLLHRNIAFPLLKRLTEFFKIAFLFFYNLDYNQIGFIVFMDVLP